MKRIYGEKNWRPLVAAHNRKWIIGDMLLLAREACMLEEEEAAGSVLAGGDVAGVLADFTLIAVALLFEV